ncbi:50S ribosomal protein L29 [Wolbachia endosymbiont of Cruorifilaria tuberocauda]|uniref:50S ribosomal protein L29 n=1 Tax=Wolbachia endosymbiont of Cruorifilaria tuberocauda TaxID=1812111 RepID=UPI00158C6393|nr:50S ribosomal protein L29 [Wolbachia endosymbiont of Cruorifilaria tuberocauda]QKX01594.1 50S ribosomal protein L29 [Wolbachia endosymbiont of Cruorifilaria tuberocauda]
MGIIEIRSKSSQELYEILTSLRKEFVNLVFQKKMGQCNNIARFSLIRKSIARILTVLNERGINEKNA